MTVFAPLPPGVVFDEPVTSADLLARLLGLARARDQLQYRVQVFQADVSGNLIADLSPYYATSEQSDPTVSWTCADAAPGLAQFALRSDISLRWGADLVALFQLVRSDDYNLNNGYPYGTYHSFPLGHFCATSPGFDDLDDIQIRTVKGYDKNYLLQSDIDDALSFAVGSTYLEAVQTCFAAAGIDFGLVTNLPSDWTGKTLPTAMSYSPADNVSYLTVINELLAASGCQQIYTDTSGHWIIDDIPDPTTQPVQWRFVGGDGSAGQPGEVKAKIMLRSQQQYSGDVWGVPNRWIFVQDGLDFAPVEGSGKYTVDNLTVPPADQSTIGRVLTLAQALQASGQADLVKQGNKIVTDALSAIETFTLQTMCWPVFRQLDVFQFMHENLPGSTTRKLQCTGWTLPLSGNPMTINAQAVQSL